MLARVKLLTTRLFTKHLLATNIATSGMFLAAGDIVCQKVERVYIHKGDGTKHDWRRTGKTQCHDHGHAAFVLLKQQYKVTNRNHSILKFWVNIKVRLNLKIGFSCTVKVRVKNMDMVRIGMVFIYKLMIKRKYTS